MKITVTGIPGWNGAANTQGWQYTGATYLATYAEWVVPPPDWASGDILSYIWWVPNAGVASTFYIRSTCQLRPESGSSGLAFLESSPSSVYINETTVANQFRRTQGLTIPAVFCDPSWFYWYGTYKAIHYLAYWYNSAGAEDINILGVEFVYTGYV